MGWGDLTFPPLSSIVCIGVGAKEREGRKASAWHQVRCQGLRAVPPGRVSHPDTASVGWLVQWLPIKGHLAMRNLSAAPWGGGCICLCTGLGTGGGPVEASWQARPACPLARGPGQPDGGRQERAGLSGKGWRTAWGKGCPWHPLAGQAGWGGLLWEELRPRRAGGCLGVGAPPQLRPGAKQLPGGRAVGPNPSRAPALTLRSATEKFPKRVTGKCKNCLLMNS